MNNTQLKRVRKLSTRCDSERRARPRGTTIWPEGNGRKRGHSNSLFLGGRVIA